MRKIIINGIDGNFGNLVAKNIQKLVPDTQLIFTVPTVKKLSEYSGSAVQVKVADFNSRENLTAVFKDASKVLLISMPFVGAKRRAAHQNAIAACVAANVKQVIYTSVISASNPLNPSIENIDHGYTESIIQNSPLDYIILRNSLFAEAFITDYFRLVAAGERVAAKNMGEGRVAFISRRDAALAAAAALNNTLLHREILNINGRVPLTFKEFLNIGNKVTGNDIEYQQQTDEEMYAYFDKIKVPRTTDGDFSKSPLKETSEGMVSFGTTVREGYLDIPVNDFSTLTNCQPRTLKYMFEHAADFQLGARHPTEK
ncbi:NAD(P)H-binding protein [Liquorilactobacillus sucicola]|uniref:NAD(P)H-binding protein n=1 Tax=Liquorilactobacillus sucicola TaxID=519050 RepID=UPI000554702E|nr:NAD(P)H-binding protein [Liquorilactobacillus sucicola]